MYRDELEVVKRRYSGVQAELDARLASVVTDEEGGEPSAKEGSGEKTAPVAASLVMELASKAKALKPTTESAAAYRRAEREGVELLTRLRKATADAEERDFVFSIRASSKIPWSGIKWLLRRSVVLLPFGVLAGAGAGVHHLSESCEEHVRQAQPEARDCARWLVHAEKAALAKLSDRYHSGPADFASQEMMLASEEWMDATERDQAARRVVAWSKPEDASWALLRAGAFEVLLSEPSLAETEEAFVANLLIGDIENLDAFGVSRQKIVSACLLGKRHGEACWTSIDEDQYIWPAFAPVLRTLDASDQQDIVLPTGKMAKLPAGSEFERHELGFRLAMEDDDDARRTLWGSRHLSELEIAAELSNYSVMADERLLLTPWTVQHYDDCIVVTTWLEAGVERLLRLPDEEIWLGRGYPSNDRVDAERVAELRKRTIWVLGLEAAIANVKIGELDAARRMLVHVDAHAPIEPARWMSAPLHYAVGDWGRAEALYRDALRQATGLPAEHYAMVRIGLGQLLMNKGDPQCETYALLFDVESMRDEKFRRGFPSYNRNTAVWMSRALPRQRHADSLSAVNGRVDTCTRRKFAFEDGGPHMIIRHYDYDPTEALPAYFIRSAEALPLDKVGQGGVEMWLDSVTGDLFGYLNDAPPILSVMRARSIAARVRGDHEAADKWQARVDRVAELVRKGRSTFYAHQLGL